MQASEKAIEMIKKFESCALKRYKCPAGVLTIGWGNTSHAAKNEICTQEQADKWLAEDVTKVTEIVIDAVDGTPLNQNQFDALVSLVFNIGGGNFRKSTMRKKILACDFEGAAMEFNRWIYAGGKILPGLVKRRAEERKVFESDD